MLHELATNTRRATLAHELADEMWNERAKTATNLLGPDHLQALSRMAGREEQWLQTHRSKEAAAYSNAVLAHQAALPPEQRHAAFGGEWSREASAPNESAKRDEEKIAGWFSKAKPKPKSTLTAGDVLIMSLAGGTTVGIGKLIDRYMGKTEITIPPLKWKIPEYIPEVRPLPPPIYKTPPPTVVPAFLEDALQNVKSAAPNLISTAGGIVGGTALGALASDKETQGRNTALGGLGGGTLAALLSHASDVRNHSTKAIAKQTLGTLGKASILGAAGLGAAALAHNTVGYYPGLLAGKIGKLFSKADPVGATMKAMGATEIPTLGGLGAGHHFVTKDGKVVEVLPTPKDVGAILPPRSSQSGLAKGPIVPPKETGVLDKAKAKIKQMEKAVGDVGKQGGSKAKDMVETQGTKHIGAPIQSKAEIPDTETLGWP